MKRLINYTQVLLLAILLISCTVYKKQNIDKTFWLVGTWENKTPRGSVFETWKKVSDDKLMGKSYMLKEKDTVVFENITIICENDILNYIPAVTNQNNGSAIKFEVKYISEKQMIFENLKHDFPQIISYKKISSDSLIAEISGTKEGKERKILFPMKKVR